jgi:hypothetical protein
LGAESSAVLLPLVSAEAFKEGPTLRAIIVMLATVGVVPIVFIPFTAFPSGKYYWFKVLSILLCTAGLFAVVAPSVIMYVGKIVVVVVVPIVVVSRAVFTGLLTLSSGRYSLFKMCSMLVFLVPVLSFVWVSFLTSFASQSNTSIPLLICLLFLGLVALCTHSLGVNCSSPPCDCWFVCGAIGRASGAAGTTLMTRLLPQVYEIV